MERRNKRTDGRYERGRKDKIWGRKEIGKTDGIINRNVRRLTT